ncbi:hypothetical protein BJX76DRAFT_143368 [Aspergillus varians]
MWLFRGAQSAVFYYVTCTPCAEAAGRRKRKKEAVRARSQRQKQQSDTIITDQPRPFHQPTPFSTNPGWMEELTLGPAPPKRRGGHRGPTHHRMESWDTGAVSTSSVPKDNTASPRTSKIGSKHLGDRWNRMLRYQREDEPLWGEEVEVDIKGSSVGISGQGQEDARTPSKYCVPRVPPVNDLHPPIVSGPKSRAETRWMLQPPPSAKVMSGKERSRTMTPPVEYRNMRMDSDNSTSRRSRHTHTLPPIATELAIQPPKSSPASSSRPPKTPEPPTQDLPRPPSPTFYAYGKDEARFVIPSSIYSPSDTCSTLSFVDDSDASPRESLHSPATPISRPMSKDTLHQLEKPRPSISRALTSVNKDNDKNIHMLQFELQEHQDLGLGQVERVRPWRWSMEF